MNEPVDGGRSKKTWILLGTAGLVACALIGLVVALLVSTSEDSIVADGPNPIAIAVNACESSRVDGIDVGDGGRSITMSTEGDESSGATLTEVVCVLDELDIPDSVVSKIDTTRALDGRQQATWGDLDASWTYHPDTGLTIVIELIAP